MTNFKQGDMVEVSFESGFPVAGTYRREFVWHGGGKYYCISSGDKADLIQWIYMRAIKKPEYIEYTQETLPKGSLWLRRKGSKPEYPIGEISLTGACIDEELHTYKAILKTLEISEDGRRTYHTAGVRITHVGELK